MIDLEARARALNERAVVDATPVGVVLAHAGRYRIRRRLTVGALAACVAVTGGGVVTWANHDTGGSVQTVSSTPTTRRG